MTLVTGLAGALLEPLEARLQQGDVAAEAVDDKAPDAGLFRGREQVQGTHEVREHAAAINIGHQDHRAVGGLGKPYVTLHDDALNHALKEVDAGACAVAREPEQVVAILRYVITGQLETAPAD